MRERGNAGGLQKKSVEALSGQGVFGELEKEKESKGIVKRIWYGGEGEDWKEKRDQREKEALENGDGYGGLIMNQIKEVFNFEKKKMEEVKEIDEEVLKRREGEKAEK